MRDIELIAHRGASHDAPENTLASFRLAWETGADGIEGDFRLSSDGEIVCIHDATTGRTAGTSLVVAESTLARLRELDVGGWKGAEWGEERIPTLREVIATVPPGKRIFIELKSGPAILLPLAAILAVAPLTPDQVVILSFSVEVVTASRQFLPHLRTLWLTDYRKGIITRKWHPTIAEIIQTLVQSGACGLASKAHRSIDAEVVQGLHVAGFEFHVWTVDAPRAAARYAAIGTDSIITNRPGWLRERLNDMSSTGRTFGEP
jgi:glycerophosphoryl diester phosphodiesterase